MIYQGIEKLDQMVHFDEAQAHCDVPCGIYDPHRALVGALTVIRMIDIMEDLAKNHKDVDELSYTNTMTRAIMVKEEHAELVKHEIRIIYGDYVKQDMIDKHPQLPNLVLSIYQAGSKARQTVDRQNGVNLLNLVNQFAEIFWETKGLSTKRVKAPYKPGEEMVLPNL